MAKRAVYDSNGNIIGYMDTTPSTGGGTGTAPSGPSDGATGAINATSITNSGTTSLAGPLTVMSPATFKGITSSEVIKGSKGFQFADGTTQSTAQLKGDKGDQGIAGLKGDTGPQGIPGPKGDQGIQGLAGANGSNGLDGAPGVKGDKGDQGLQGIQGIKGDQGIQGVKGDTGLTGAKGDTGANGATPATTTAAAGWGPAAQINNSTVGVMGNATPMNFPGTSNPWTFTPITDTALTGIAVTNYAASGATVFFYLQNVTTNTLAYNYNSGNGIAAGTTASNAIASPVPLKANNTYQWYAQRVAAGLTTIQVMPQIFIPSSSNVSAVSFYSTGFLISSSTNIAAASQGAILQQPGAQPQVAYYRNAASSYLYYMTLTIAGTGVVQPFFYNVTTSANAYAGFANITLTANQTTFQFGPFTPSQAVFVANNTYQFQLYNGSGGATVTYAYMTMQVGF